jgi:hypothetical protein
MTVNQTNSESARDAFLAELTVAALDAANRFGVCGPSSDLEVDLRHQFDAMLRDRRSLPGRTSLTWDDRAAALTAAAYQVMLNHHFSGAFVDLEMDVWLRLRQVIRRNRFLLVTSADSGTKSGSRAPQHLSGVLALAEPLKKPE